MPAWSTKPEIFGPHRTASAGGSGNKHPTSQFSNRYRQRLKGGAMNSSLRIILAFISVCIPYNLVWALDNGLALTPPMGFMTWQRFRCITDCTKYPDECISDQLIRRTVDHMVNDGFREAGYEYVIIDDCWLEKNRSDDGYLVPDRTRFPQGMKSLADYVHSKGLKFGIYENYGNKTCAGYPGLYGNEKRDISMFADWGIDYIKVDGCYYDGDDYSKGYDQLKTILNKTGRPIVYSCSYPAYEQENSILTDYAYMAENCNLWRNYDDIEDSWNSLTNILDWFAQKQEFISKYAGPGHWNDPDMLLIGNFGLSYTQSQVQMALWAVLAAPLLMSTDLATIKPEFRDILLNKRIIEVNQDPLGIQGLRVYQSDKIQVWTRKVIPTNVDHHSYAIAFYSRREDGAPRAFSTTLKRIGLKFSVGYTIQDLYTGENWLGVYRPNSTISVRVPPLGVVFLKATVVL
uniref:Alpha-galactosidase n=4 Tax=Lygus hesperus TaxID=30085 RepID=A0A0K8TAY4_LYGHE